MAQLKTIILAAGKGTRFKSDTPKVLHLLAGKPVLNYVLDVAENLSSLKTYVVVGHQAERVAQLVGARAVIVEQKEQLGTAHAVQMCMRHLKGFRGDVLVMCGDTPLLDKGLLRQLLTRHARTKSVGTVLTANIQDPSGYGRIMRDAKGAFIAIREEKDASADEKKIHEINTGVYCFKADALLKFITRVRRNENKKEFYLTDTIELFLANGLKVETLVTNDWTVNLGLNTRADLALAEAILREKILKRLMADGVTITDPATTYVENGVTIGQDTVIYPCTYIHHGVRIGKNCSVGPFARLRPGTVLGNGVAVGNFAEISRSQLADGVTMKHFSFLGDARVGAEANIGCGTVTANYDGKNKNVTKIGKGAFIGCDTILVAPVEVGDGAMAGAGSVVARGRNIPAGMLAVGMPARVIKKVNK
ncbi:MAG: bifunctional N-acetylglucosamine-1-phosphate uridyltransferase/glucosamine-1-phosphate acetyltransferase [Candidatus Omnitrophica bacterium]|nr:bifunctional N-acetylglucosamine-1-phosphate uridyltransferase/glucosamine-1-phosphate acetyltransferase [Candidatus Omnitrophota bacterium]